MKKRIRHFSKSTLSIILSLCMLISCVSVGLIATDAARIAEEERVGWDTNSLTFNGQIKTDKSGYSSEWQTITMSGNSSNYYYFWAIIEKNKTVSFGFKDQWNQYLKGGTKTAVNATNSTTGISRNYWTGMSKNESGADLSFTTPNSTYSQYIVIVQCWTDNWNVRVDMIPCIPSTVNVHYQDQYGSYHKYLYAWQSYHGGSSYNSTNAVTNYTNHVGDRELNGSYDSVPQDTRAAEGVTEYTQDWNTHNLSYYDYPSNYGVFYVKMKDSSGASQDLTINRDDVSGKSEIWVYNASNDNTTIVVTDRVALRNKINDTDIVNAYNSGANTVYTVESYTTFKTAYQDAARKFSAYATTQAEINSAITSLQSAFDALEIASTPSLDSFTIDGAASKTLNIGEEATLASTTSHTDNEVTYSTASDAISITGTTVKALKPVSSATITATLVDGETYTKTVTVKVNTPALTLTYNPATILTGGATTKAPTVTATGANASSEISNKTFTITSGGTSGTVAADGKVTSTSVAGTVTVQVTGTVSHNGVSYTSATGTANITVQEPASVYFKYDQSGGTNTKGLDGTKMAYDNSLNLYKLSVDLEKGTEGNWYYIVVYDASESNNLSHYDEVLTEELRTGGGHTLYSGNNEDHPIHLVATVTGTYNFYFDAANNKLYVEYPHTVTFNMNNHGDAPDSQVITYGGKATKPDDPTATGYTFGGWYKESDCTNAFNFDTDTITANTTLYAKWSSLPQLGAPDIKYNNAATTPVTMDAAEGSKARITWAAVNNAGSYEIFKDGDPLGTTTNLYFDIERGYSHSGTYTVKAIPGNAAAHSPSNASNGIQFTFNKVQLTAPVVAADHDWVLHGHGVTFSISGGSSTATLGKDFKYQHTGADETSYTDVSGSSWSTENLTNTTAADATPTFKFKAVALKTDYFADSSETSKQITVKPSFALDSGKTSTFTPGTGTEMVYDATKGAYYLSVTVSDTSKYYFRFNQKDANRKWAGDWNGNYPNVHDVVVDGEKVAAATDVSGWDNKASLHYSGAAKKIIVWFDYAAKKTWIVGNSTTYQVTFTQPSSAGSSIKVADSTTSPHTFYEGETAEYTVTAGTGYVITSVTANGSTVAVDRQSTYTGSFSVSADTSVSAEIVPQYTITKGEAAGGSFTVKRDNMEVTQFIAGDELTLTATADAYHDFTKFAVTGGKTATFNNSPATLDTTGATGNITITPTFTAKSYSYTTEAYYSATGADGSYTNALSNAVTPASGSATYENGVTVTAASKDGYSFYKWSVSGGEVDNANSASTTFKPTANGAKATALYKRAYTITSNTPTGGTVTVDKEHPVAGESYTVTVAASTGYKFKSLTVGGASVTVSNNKYTATASGETATVPVVAEFEPDTTLEFYIAGRFHVRTAAGSNDWTNSFDSGDWANDGGKNIKFSYDHGTLYKVETYASPKELTTTISNQTPWFFVYDKTHDKQWHPASGVSFDNTTTSANLTSNNAENNVRFNSSSTDTPVTIYFDAATHKLSYEIPVFYDVTITEATGGTVTASPARATEDTEITLTVTPDTGYHLDSLTVIKDGEQGPIQVTNNKFTMPAGNVTVTAVFAKNVYSGFIYQAKASESGNALTDAAFETYTHDLSSAVTGAATGNEIDGIAINAAKSGYTFYKWVVTGGTLTKADTTASNTFKPTANGATLTAYFRKNYTLSLTQSTGGAIAADKTELAAGDAYTITATPESGQKLSKLLVGGTDVISSVENQIYNGKAGGNSDTITVVPTFTTIPPTTVRINKRVTNYTHIYIWTTINDERNPVVDWPGEEFKNDSDWTVDPVYPDYYVRNFQKDWGGFQVIFSSGKDTTQTADSAVYENGEQYFIDFVDGTNAPVLTKGLPTYTIAGTKGMMGSEWSTTDTNNNMTAGDNNTFTLEKTNVSKGHHEFKVVTNHDYENGSYPTNNQTLDVLYNHSTVNFTYSPTAASNKLTAVVSGGDFEVKTEATNGTAVISQSAPVSGDATSLTLNAFANPSATTYDVYVKVTPDEHYEVTGWSQEPVGTPTKVGDVVTAKFTVTNDVTITPTIAKKKHNVVFTNQNTGGTVAVNSQTASPQVVNEAETYTVTLTPATGYEVNTFTINGTSHKGDLTNPDAACSYTATMGNADETISVTFTKINYSLSGAATPDYGSVKFYSDSDCTNEITTATYQQTIYAKFLPATAYYALGSYSVSSGSGATVNSGTGNIRPVVMGAHDLTLTANVVAATPVIGSCPSMTVPANEGFTYAQPSVTPPANSTLTFSYTFQGETNNTGTFTAPVTAGTYPLTITASNKPDGISVAATASVTVTITVTYRNEEITYYVDMHDNVISGSGVEVAIVDAQNSSKVKSIDGEACKATLTQQGVGTNHPSSVYAAGIKTPFVKNGDEYNALHIRITYNGVSYWKELNSNQIKTVQNTKSMWFEAVNESSLDLKLTTADYTGTPKVASGKKRIYVAKPISWESDTPWTTVGIYYWDKDISTEWKSADNEMKHLGKDSDYHYYYADIPSGANNIIFQGREGVDTYSQTNNIENIKTNSFVLYKDGTSPKGKAADAAAAIPALTKYISTAQMNKGANNVDISPVRYTAASVKYDNSNDTVVSVTDEGKINALKSGTATITVKLHSSISEKITTPGAYFNDDVISFDISVTVHDPNQFYGFNIMSLGTSEYTFDIPQVSNNNKIIQPGYFVMGKNDIAVTVTGLVGVGSSTKSAVITSDETVSVTDLGSQTTRVKVKYADPEEAFTTDYSNICLNGTITTRSIRTDAGSRYGFTEWQKADESKPDYKVKKTISEHQTEPALDGVETAVTSSFEFDRTSTYYKAVFTPYEYVDVTFTYQYYEYKPRLVDGLFNYQYEYDNGDYLDETVGTEKFKACHNAKEYVRTKFEVRKKTAASIEVDDDLVTQACKAIEAMPQNSYYDYSIDTSCITIESRNAGTYSAEVTVKLKHKPRMYSVYVNGGENPIGEYYYQQYVTVNKPVGLGEHVKWYECEDNDVDLTTGTPNYPLLSTGNSYKFRVKDDTHLRVVNGSLNAQDFNRSEVDFMDYDLTHLNNKEYVMQNFYIADFFNPMETYETATRKCDDATFVGGGVVYYSMKGGSPNSATAAYVDQDTGTIDKEAIAEMLKENIESSITEDKYSKTFEQYEAELGTDEAMKIAYGTEIPVTQNYDRNGKTGIMYRYLPLQTYQTNKNKELIVDENGNFVTTVNDNTFRYSNTLQAYQYIYASGNENKETNEGRNMRLYAYYVYSYQGYDLETNVPETRYVVVISDNYSDASTYWAGN